MFSPKKKKKRKGTDYLVTCLSRSYFKNIYILNTYFENHMTKSMHIDG